VPELCEAGLEFQPAFQGDSVANVSLMVALGKQQLTAGRQDRAANSISFSREST
jgi:hypothetical protein